MPSSTTISWSGETDRPTFFAAFVVYEYIITFDREVSLFWRRRFTGATLLFLLNRYITLLTQIMDSFSTSKVLRSDEVR